MNTNEIVEYKANAKSITLTPDIVRRYFTDNPNVTDGEVMFFMKLCEHRGMDPWLKEAYLVKYGNSPAQNITGIAMFTRIAAESKLLEYWDSGIICYDKETGKIEYTNGLIIPGYTLIGGWANGKRTDWSKPTQHEVNLSDYIGKKSDGTITRMWSSMPAAMIQKVAGMGLLRKLLADKLGNAYCSEEMPEGEEATAIGPKDVTQTKGQKNVTPPKGRKTKKESGGTDVQPDNWIPWMKSKLEKLLKEELGDKRDGLEQLIGSLERCNEEFADLRFSQYSAMVGHHTDTEYIQALGKAKTVEEVYAIEDEKRVTDGAKAVREDNDPGDDPDDVKSIPEKEVDKMDVESEILKIVDAIMNITRDMPAVTKSIDEIGLGDDRELVLRRLNNYYDQLNSGKKPKMDSGKSKTPKKVPGQQPDIF